MVRAGKIKGRPTQWCLWLMFEWSKLVSNCWHQCRSNRVCIESVAIQGLQVEDCERRLLSLYSPQCMKRSSLSLSLSLSLSFSLSLSLSLSLSVKDSCPLQWWIASRISPQIHFFPVRDGKFMATGTTGLFQWPHDVHGVVKRRSSGRLAGDNWTHRPRKGQSWGTKLVCLFAFLFVKSCMDRKVSH